MSERPSLRIMSTVILALCRPLSMAYAWEITATIKVVLSDPSWNISTSAGISAKDLDREVASAAQTRDHFHLGCRRLERSREIRKRTHHTP